MEFINAQLQDIAKNEKGAIISGPFGSNISSKFFVEQGIPVIRGNNLTLGDKKYIDDGYVYITREKADELNCWAVENDLIFTAAGTIGQVGLITQPLRFNEYVISNKQIRVRLDNKKIDYLYAYYWFSSPWIIKRLQNNNKGSTVPLLTLSEIKELPINYPKDLPTQKKIADVLSCIDDKIALNNKTNSELENMAKTVYDYWFTQFYFPDANGNPYKSSGGKMEYNEVLKREIPAGWEVGRLDSICETVLGGTPSTDKEEYWNGDIPWLNSGEVAEFPIITAEKTVTELGIEESATELLPAGSVTLSITRHLRPSILTMDACINQSVVGLKENNRFNKYFIYPFIESKIDHYMKLRTGAQQPHINKETVDETILCIPTDEILKQYYETVGNIYERIITNAKESKELTKLRDYLLPLLMNGQVEVK